MKVSIIVPNYNGREILSKNLPQILKTGAAEIIVVDDASTDGSVEIIKNLKFKIKNYKVKLKILENEKNMGFASTVNRGVEEASGGLVLLLNSDVVPTPDFLPPLIKHFSDPKVFAVGCLQKCQEGKQIIFRGRGIGKFERGFLLHARGTVSGEDTSEVSSLSRVKSRETPRMVEESKKTLWVSGGAGIFRKKIWEKLGGFNPLYNPFYWEDIDLSYRALKAGYKILFEPKSIVIHFQHQGSIRRRYSSPYIKTIAYRNQILFAWLNITDTLYLFQHFLFLPYHFLKALITADYAFTLGFLQALVKLPQVLIHRRQNLQLNKVSDKEIFKNSYR